MSEFLEPFAIRMTNDPTRADQHWLNVSNGRTRSGISRAWLPEASLTLVMTWRCTSNASVRVYLEDTMGARVQIFQSTTQDEQVMLTHIVPQPGIDLRALPSTVGAGQHAELVVTVVPTPFSQ